MHGEDWPKGMFVVDQTCMRDTTGSIFDGRSYDRLVWRRKVVCWAELMSRTDSACSL